jgi:hypothetical protein
LIGRRHEAAPVGTGEAMHQHRVGRIPEDSHQLIELFVG